MKKKFIFIILLSLLNLRCTILVAFVARPVEEREIGDINSDKKVLIAAHESNFKEVLLNEVIDKLLSEGWYIKVINVSNLSGINTEDYNAVVIITTKMVMSLHKYVADYIQNTDEKEKIVIYFTEVGKKSIIPRAYRNLDAISSASRIEKIDSIVTYIINNVNQRL